MFVGIIISLIISMPIVIVGLIIIRSEKRFKVRFFDQNTRYTTMGELIGFRYREETANGVRAVDTESNLAGCKPVFKFEENGKAVHLPANHPTERFYTEDIGKMLPILCVANTPKRNSVVFINNDEHLKYLHEKETELLNTKVSKIGAWILGVGIFMLVFGLLMFYIL